MIKLINSFATLLLGFFLSCLSIIEAKETILILGDSITFANHWVTDLATTMQATPKYKDADFINVAVPSETVSGLSENGHAGGRFPRPCIHDRLTNVLTQTKPTLILACYGMNDGIFQNFDESRFTAWQNGLKRLEKQAKAIKTPIIFITPFPFDPINTPNDYDTVLKKYGDWLSEQKKQGWNVINIRPGLIKAIQKRAKENPSFNYAGDKVHPDPEGHRLMAIEVIKQLTPLLRLHNNIPLLKGTSYDEANNRIIKRRNEWLTQTGHRRPEIPGYRSEEQSPKLPDDKTSQWNGFTKLDFTIDGRNAFIVLPHKAALGKPWIWRTEFFGHEPQADIELLNHGFAAVYIDMQNLYGGPEAMNIMNTFYRHMTEKRNYSLTPVLEGFSRGGLFAFNWAAQNPEKIGAIYVDNPVCDFKSWPGGKFKGPGSKDDWSTLLKVYGLTNEEAMKYAKNPIDTCHILAKHQIPVIFVSKTEDTLVPLAENTDIFENRYRKAGGPIQVIRRPGNHHPHSLKEPAPIVDFILKNTFYPNPIRIACLGDSITYGVGASSQANRWTSQLQNTLGEAYKVHNYGISGRTMLSKGNLPLINDQPYQYAIDCHADIILIALGTNDSKAQNWQHKNDFEKDYTKMINELKKDNPQATIYCLLPIPALTKSPDIDNDIICKEIIPSIKKVALENRCNVIDLNKAVPRSVDFIPDNVHPNDKGHAIMSESIYQAIKKH